MKIFLIRHSESQDDLINCYGGTADWDLTQAGAKKVEQFRPTFEGFGVQKIYASPLRRAYKTAEVMNKGLGLPLTRVFELHETSQFGYMAGVERELAKELFGWLLERPEGQGIGYYNRKSFPGGEHPDDLDKRVAGAVGSVLENAEGLERIAIVTHGGVIRSFFWNLLKDKRKLTDIGDVAFAEIDFSDGEFRLVTMHGIMGE